MKVGGDEAVQAGYTGADFDALPRQEISAGERGIDAGDQDLARSAAAAWAALVPHNDPPRIFRRGGALVRLRRHEDGRLAIETLGVDQLRHTMARVTDWHVVRGKRAVPAYPPVPVIRDMLAQPDPPVPGLDRIASVPILGVDGAVLPPRATSRPPGRSSTSRQAWRSRPCRSPRWLRSPPRGAHCWKRSRISPSRAPPTGRMRSPRCCSRSAAA